MSFIPTPKINQGITKKLGEFWMSLNNINWWDQVVETFEKMYRYIWNFAVLVFDELYYMFQF